MSGSLAVAIAERRRDSADRPFITCRGETVTYGQFAQRLDRVAAALAGRGIAKGDKVALFLPNGLPFVLTMLAAARLGAVFVPAHSELTAREVEYIVRHSDAKLLVNGAEYERLLNATDGDYAPADVQDTDAAAILYTSGTTGNPKGVLLSHLGYRLNAAAFAERVRLTANDTLYCVLPLAHLNAQRSSLLPAAMTGAHLILAERFSANAFWRDVRDYGVTFFSIMPAIASILLRQTPAPGEREHRVRLCVTPITVPLLEAFEDRFGITVVSTYGLTEGMLNVMNFIDGPERRREAIGKPLLPEVHSVRVVDEDDRPVAPRTTGEITLRSPAMMLGYYKDPEATATALRNGWLHTGDLGYLDEDGYLYFAGRKKEIIRRAGENIAPGEIEMVLAEHPAVQEVVVVGVSDPVRDEEVKACIVLRPDVDEATAAPASLLEFCEERLARFKVPRYLEFRSDFPRTPATMRVRRGELQMLAAGEGIRLYDRMEDRWLENR